MSHQLDPAWSACFNMSGDIYLLCGVDVERKYTDLFKFLPRVLVPRAMFWQKVSWSVPHTKNMVFTCMTWQLASSCSQFQLVLVLQQVSSDVPDCNLDVLRFSVLSEFFFHTHAMLCVQLNLRLKSRDVQTLSESSPGITATCLWLIWLVWFAKQKPGLSYITCRGAGVKTCRSWRD